MAELDNIFRRWSFDREAPAVPSAKSVFVVGLGRFGTAVASALTELDVEVMAVDADQQVVESWADRLSHVRIADGTNTTTLKQLGAVDFDAVVVGIGTDLEASILTTAALIDLGATNVWAKAITSQHGRILQRVGAHHVVYPERDMGERVAHVVTGQVIDYFQLDENFVLAELGVPSELVGASLADSGIRQEYAITVVCIKPIGHRFTYATPETVLGRDDILLIAGAVADVERFSDFASH